MSDAVGDILDSLAEAVREACENGRPLRIKGGGSKDFLGYPDADAETLDVTGIRGVISYEPGELVLRVRAGTRLAEVEEILAGEAQMLGFEPPDFGGSATMGGVISAGISGPRRPFSGSVRDFVLGIGLITGEGKRAAFGGQVMKNVAGYDVSRLVTGAMGTLGVVTEVSLKVLPRPGVEITLVQERERADALALMLSLGGRSVPLSATCYHDGRLYLRLSGSDSAVTRAARDLGGQEADDAIWRKVANHDFPALAKSHDLWRISVPPASDVLLEEACVLEWGGGQRWLADPDFNPRDVLTGSPGHATLFRRTLATEPAFHPLSPVVEGIHRALKHRFDPRGIMNFSRMYRGL